MAPATRRTRVAEPFPDGSVAGANVGFVAVEVAGTARDGARSPATDESPVSADRTTPTALKSSSDISRADPKRA